VVMELLGKTEESKLDKNSRKRILLTSENKKFILCNEITFTNTYN
jgi:hypothetical protein